MLVIMEDFPGGSDGKASAYNEGDPGSIPSLGRSPGERNGNSLQYSCSPHPAKKKKGAQRNNGGDATKCVDYNFTLCNFTLTRIL